jgi:non-heme chloroperoxidase
VTTVTTEDGRGKKASTITTEDGSRIYYKDWGEGQPVVFSHGWPLNADAWESQMVFLAQNSYRAIAHDRRGHGRSSQPSGGNEMDTYADDLATLIEELDLRDAVLVGHSTGGGEVARYVGRHGADRLRASVLIESLAPSFAKSGDNPSGVDAAGVTEVQRAILEDRYAWLTGLIGDFLNLDEYRGKRVSDDTVRAMWNAGAEASPYATWACPPGWLDDFTDDITHIDVPTLIMHGTADRILPIEGQGRRLHAALPDAHYVEVEGGPHVMCVTHAEEVNRELIGFLTRVTDQRAGER